MVIRNRLKYTDDPDLFYLSFTRFPLPSPKQNLGRGKNAILMAASTVRGPIDKSDIDKTQSNIYELVIKDLSGKKKYLNVVLGHNNKK